MATLALLIPIVAIVSTFSFIGVAAWVDGRRKEREAFYRSEVLKKVVETPGDNSAQVLAMMREEERIAEVRRIEAQKLGGLVTTSVGVALIVLFYSLNPHLWPIGLIVLGVGVALLLHVFFFTTRP